jgi:hypothetical protein
VKGQTTSELSDFLHGTIHKNIRAHQTALRATSQPEPGFLLIVGERI